MIYYYNTKQSNLQMQAQHHSMHQQIERERGRYPFWYPPLLTTLDKPSSFCLRCSEFHAYLTIGYTVTLILLIIVHCRAEITAKKHYN